MRRLLALLMLVALLSGPTYIARAMRLHRQHGDVQQIGLNVRGHFPCNEDEVLIGVGQYDNGRWTAWRCYVADDLPRR